MSTFNSRYIFDGELDTYGLPSVAQLPNIMNLIDGASALIDAYCGRIDAFGNGSLAYCTYAERQLIVDGRNQFRTMFKPLVALDTTTLISLSGLNAVSGNHFYTGFQPNLVNTNAGNLSPIVSLSGRYSYGRKSSMSIFPDSNYAANPLMLAAFFGGPPQFTPIDISMTDVYANVGELWVPAGLMLASYSEILLSYNSGYDPRNMPQNVKIVTSELTKNFIARAGGITNVKSYSGGKIHAQFTDSLIDDVTQTRLAPFKHVVAM